MSEPHIIIGPAVGPGGPTVASAGASPATASPAEPADATSTSTAAADAGPAHAAEVPRGHAAPGKAEPKHRGRAAARNRAAEPDAGDPAAPPAGSAQAANRDRAEQEAEAESDDETRPASRRAGGMAVELARNLLITLWHLLRAVGSRVWGVMVRYPRHSLAAVASVLILSGIEYTQWKGTKTPPVNQISAKQAASGQSGKESAGSKADKIAAAASKPAGREPSQSGAAPPKSEQPKTAAPVAAAPATLAPGESTSSSAIAAPSDPPLPLIAPNGQTGLAGAEKSTPARTESSVVSAPGLMVAASETLPPPASSLAKDGATLLASTPESAPPAPPPAGGQEPATEAGKSAPVASAPPEPAPAPAPLAAKPEKGPEDGGSQKPAPSPAAKEPEPAPAPAPAPLSLDSVPTPAAKAADSALVPPPANPPAASGQTAEVSPLAAVEAAPPVTAPAITAAGLLPVSSPAPEHDQGAPEVGRDAAKGPGTSQSKPATDAANPKPEPAPDPGHAPAIAAQAEPRSNDKPQLGPSLANSPMRDAPSSELKSTPGSPAAPSSGSEAAHKGDVQLVPSLNSEPEPSSSSSQTGEKPATPETKPAETPAPLSTPSSTRSPDPAAKVEPASARSDEPIASSKNRAESPPDSSAPAATETTPPGWVPIRNSGKVPLAAGDEPDSRTAGGDDAAAGSDSIRDARGHAARDMSFEMESPRSRAVMGNLETNSTRRAGGQSGSAAGARRVETVPHVVETGENFWTISGQYYGSGRYYRALWKANADRCPQIDGLHVNDVIIIPPPEDLDPNYIDPPGEHARSPRAGRGTKPGDPPAARDRRGNGMTDASETAALSAAPRRGTAGARTNQLSTSDDGIPIQRSSRTSSELELPAASSDSIFSRDRRSAERRADLTAGEGPDDEPDSRAGRRSRSANGESSTIADTRPVYKVRPNDTLRSIARDTLGSSRRANEILDLNRDIIDDPSSLIVGQMLELPEDARTSIRRRASR
ncbi:MAG: LysM peptidoglycan-binding domain-containing protein [Isosphaeraceae bacterium]